jgi:hypothetical protein
MNDRMLAFITGDVLVSASLIGAGDVTKTIVLGFVGGIISMFSKDVYNRIKGKINKDK